MIRLSEYPCYLKFMKFKRDNKTNDVLLYHSERKYFSRFPISFKFLADDYWFMD